MRARLPGKCRRVARAVRMLRSFLIVNGGKKKVIVRVGHAILILGPKRFATRHSQCYECSRKSSSVALQPHTAGTDFISDR